MAGSREKVRMADDEVTALLEECSKVQVATIGADGFPHLTTLFHVVRDGRIAFWTYRSSQKVRNLERDDRVTALVEAGEAYDQLRGVSIQGRGEIVRDPEVVREVGGQVAVRMFGVGSLADLGDIGRDAIAQQATKRVVVVVHPDRVASWDHRKLG